MKGVVLCGGQSVRMGSDKGLIIGGEKTTWAQRTAALFDSLPLPAVISVNEKQHIQYHELFHADNLISDIDALPAKGPLKGILSVHLRYPLDDLLALATDMIYMENEVLHFLLHMQEQEENREAYVIKNGEQVEPLCAIYTAPGLQKLYERCIKNELEKYSMMYALEQLDTLVIPAKTGWEKFFRNVNTRTELTK